VTRHFCTYFDHNYLPRGMVMLESLHEHCPEAHVHVLCLSDECHDALSSLAYPFVSLIRLAELEAADPEFAATRPTRSLIEYYFTITPCLPWHLLTGCGLDEITYLDADMLFFSSPEPIFAEAGDASVIITPHRFAAHLKDWERYGIYNVSWLTFRHTEDGLACLSWYRNACLEWCRDLLEEERFADQKYLNAFPVQFSGVHCMAHPGGGVAPWNLADCVAEKNRERVSVNGAPLIFYHAQGLKHIVGPFYSSGLLEYFTRLSPSIKKYILSPYVEKYALATAMAKNLVHNGNFFGVRGEAGSFIARGRKILDEWRKHTLVMYFS